MARSQAVIEAAIDALRAKMEKGTLSVQHGDTRVINQTISEMAIAMQNLQSELQEARSDSVRQVRFNTSKGLGFR